jgi:hypothetical protein
MHGRSKRRLGHGLAARRWLDGAVACSPTARRWQGVVGDLKGVTGKVSGKEERTGAHRSGGSTVRRCKRRRAAAFIVGEGAPVVASGVMKSCSSGEARE